MNVDTDLSPHDDPDFVAAWIKMEERGYQWSESNIEKAHLGWLMARATPPMQAEASEAEIKRLRGLLIDPGDPAWEDMRGILVAELRKAGLHDQAAKVAEAEGTDIPSWIALNLMATIAKTQVEASTLPGEVVVTQADREAAASMMSKGGRKPLAAMIAAHMRDGIVDNDPIVQAFARHRLLSTPPTTPALAAMNNTTIAAQIAEKLKRIGNPTIHETLAVYREVIGL